MAERLTESPDDIVLEIVFSAISSPIIVIAKSQTSALPLPMCGESAVCGSDMNVEFTSREISTFVCMPPVNGFHKGGWKTHAFDCRRGQIVHPRQICRTYRSRVQCHTSGGN